MRRTPTTTGSTSSSSSNSRRWSWEADEKNRASTSLRVLCRTNETVATRSDDGRRPPHQPTATRTHTQINRRMRSRHHFRRNQLPVHERRLYGGVPAAMAEATEPRPRGRRLIYTKHRQTERRKQTLIVADQSTGVGDKQRHTDGRTNMKRQTLNTE